MSGWTEEEDKRWAVETKGALECRQYPREKGRGVLVDRNRESGSQEIIEAATELFSQQNVLNRVGNSVFYLSWPGTNWYNFF